MAARPKNTRFVLCIDDQGSDDLEKGKVYRVVPDSVAQKSGLLRIIDDSSEDYLYPASCFVPIELSSDAKKALLA